MPPLLPPYALAVPAFPFRSLAALAGRAPLGGPREVALAAFLSARLAYDALQPEPLPPAVRAARAAAARGWLSSLTLPSGIRLPFTRLIDATGGEAAGVATALETVTAVIADYLDAASRSELERLSQAIVR